MYMIGIHLSLVKATWPRINQWQSLFSWAKVYEYNNVPCLRSPTYPQILLNYCFQFLLTITVIPREIEGNGYAKFLVGGGGVNKVLYGVYQNMRVMFCSLHGLLVQCMQIYDILMHWRENPAKNKDGGQSKLISYPDLLSTRLCQQEIWVRDKHPNGNC